MVGVEPTGERVTLRAIEIDRFEGGLLAETWTQSDMLSLLEQLDVRCEFGERIYTLTSRFSSIEDGFRRHVRRGDGLRHAE